jgi:hypothetical protein
MMLGIDARASEPEEETSHPSITKQPYDPETAAGNVARVLMLHGYASWVTKTRIPTTAFLDIMSRHGFEFHVSSQVCDLLLLWVRPQSSESSPKAVPLA